MILTLICRENINKIKAKTKLFKDLNTLAKDATFHNATTVYPVTNTDDFYRLHAYFSKHHLEVIQRLSNNLELKSYRIANGTISNNILEIRWPLGVPLPSTPETRHDILTWHLLNRSHIFLPNDANNIEPLNSIEALDLDKVLELTKQYATYKYSTLQYMGIHTIYRRFDATRGMDYQLHLNFRETGKFASISQTDTLTKSFQVIKPLGRVEVVPSPYVTESTRIAILIPTFEHQVEYAQDFIKHYESTCMHLSAKYKADGSRIAWVSIRLRPALSDSVPDDHVMLNSLYGHNEILSIAVADLALPKIGLESLVLMASNSITFKPDFLNRVRMNTIQGFQVYSPIGFMLYPCRLASFCKDCESCDVSQGSGYFDKWNYDVISFYSRDYVQARKLVETSLPIMRMDTDIERLFTRADKSINNILDMFVSSKLSVHILRGVEPNLRYGGGIRHFVDKQRRENGNSLTLPKCLAATSDVSDRNSNSKSLPEPLIGSSQRKCIHLASRKQIGDAIIRYEDKSIIHK
uniref:Hexosyltransferase n=1 Tax=Glossina austeni TaxID=7395 RepID=A0A1A9VC24_GLOAU